MSTQAELLGLNRSSLYYQPVPPSPEESALKHRIDQIYTAYPFYGYRKITKHLQLEGVQVNHKVVARHMGEMGLEAIYPSPNLSKRAHQASIYPYLLKNVTASMPNHIWGIDIIYIRLTKGWIPGRCPGLVLALCRELGSGSNAAIGVCAASRNACVSGRSSPGISHEGLTIQVPLCFDRAISEAINQVTTKTITPIMSATMNVFVSKPLVNIE